MSSTTPLRFGLVPLAAMVAAATLLAAGCSGKKAATQVAAKVNKEEISVHQINFVLDQQRGPRPEQAASAAQQVLERLIDQELQVQRAEELKVDRDPRVVQTIEAARRDIVARAYLEKISQGAPKPTAEEVKQYFDAHPALFTERRVYNLQEIGIQAAPQQFAELQGALQSAKDINDFVAYLKAHDFRFSGGQVVRAAEQLPLSGLDKLASMKEGQSMLTATPNGAQVIVVVSSRTQPVDLDRARPAIEQFLLNEHKRKLIEDDTKALRAGAKIEYVGDFGKKDSAAGAALAGSAPEAAAAKAPSTEAVREPTVPVQAASMPSATLEQGVKGLK